ncbi:MAG: hypothetical protein RIG62_00480 [Cyclobacteriaceae bacterium]
MTKGYFHEVLTKEVGRLYKLSFFENTFLKCFLEDDPLKLGDTVEYKMQQTVYSDLIEHFIKFKNKFHCPFYVKNEKLVFTPEFSEIRNTFWEKEKQKAL